MIATAMFGAGLTDQEGTLVKVVTASPHKGAIVCNRFIPPSDRCLARDGSTERQERHD